MITGERGVGERSSSRQLYHVIIHGQEKKLLPIYLHLATLKDILWFQQSSEIILSELCDVLIDNLDLIQQQVVEQQENEFKWNLYRLRGENIALAYKIQKRTQRGDCILVNNTENDSNNYQFIQKASFALNPLYIFPYGTYPLLPGPMRTSTTTTTITDFYQIVK